MNFEEFLQKMSSKVGPKSAFSLTRDARIQALQDLLIEKEVVTKEEVEKAQEAQLEKIADNISKMPPLPNS